MPASYRFLCSCDRRCYCSAWFPWQHICPRRKMRTVTITQADVDAARQEGYEAGSRQASREDRPLRPPHRRRPQRRPANDGYIYSDLRRSL